MCEEKIGLYPKEGFEWLLSILRGKYMLEHYIKRGPAWFTEALRAKKGVKPEKIDLVNSVRIDIAKKLYKTQIIEGQQSIEESPFAYGENPEEQMYNLGRVLSLPYLFVSRMGKTNGWYEGRLKKPGTVRKIKISDKDLEDINKHIKIIAVELYGVEILQEIKA